MDQRQHQNPAAGDGKIFRAKWVLLAFLAVAAFFLITEHRGHLSELAYYLPFEKTA